VNPDPLTQITKDEKSRLVLSYLRAEATQDREDIKAALQETVDLVSRKMLDSILSPLLQNLDSPPNLSGIKHGDAKCQTAPIPSPRSAQTP